MKWWLIAEPKHQDLPPRLSAGSPGWAPNNLRFTRTPYAKLTSGDRFKIKRESWTLTVDVTKFFHPTEAYLQWMFKVQENRHNEAYLMKIIFLSKEDEMISLRCCGKDWKSEDSLNFPKLEGVVEVEVENRMI